MNLIQRLLLQHLPSARKNTSGWTNFNCPMCVHNHQPRPDTKQRGGLYVTPTGGIKYHCFNCKFKSTWEPGMFVGPKLRKLFKVINVSKTEINEAVLFALKLRESGEVVEINSIHQDKDLTKSKLPKGAKPFSYWIEQAEPHEKFLKALEYLMERHEDLPLWSPNIYWSPLEPERIIFPLTYFNDIYGWTARLIRPPKNKYESKYTSDNKMKFIFNVEKMFDRNRNFVIITEGPLDAIAVDGISILGSELSDIQVKWINSIAEEKEIIVIPDRDKSGKQLMNLAMEQGWSISFPPFDKTINDPLDAVKFYGRILTIKLIIDHREDNPLKINVKRSEWF